MTPADQLRESIKALPIDIPEAKFRYDIVSKVSDIIELWWTEMQDINKEEKARAKDREDLAQMSMIRALNCLVSGTMAFFGDEHAKKSTLILIAMLISSAENQIGENMIPTRELVDAAHRIDNVDEEEGEETVH